MEFRILGPLAVADGEREVALGGAKQRSLLAVLLLRRNQLVSSDRLVDELWGERPPATALKTVQVYVSQLRKLLGSSRIETHGHGYVLRLVAGELDVERVEELVARSREERTRAATATLEQALALFRGEPLQDLAYEPWAQPEIARLQELRLVVLGLRLEAELALGHHARVVPELERLVREHPEREWLRAQLMLALYRSGRQAEALDVYREGRRLLDEQLGLAPGPELRQLEQRVLRHDPSLAPPAAPLRERARRRRGLVLVLAGAALLLAAAVGAAVVELTRGAGGGGGGGAALEAVAPDGVGILDPTSSRLVGRVPIPGGPSLVAGSGNVVWVASDASRTISSIEAGEPAPTHVVAPNAVPNALAAADDAVWVLDGSRRELVRIDAAYGAVTRRIVLPRAPPSPATNRRPSSFSVAVGAGALWVTDGSTRLLRIDPREGRPVRADDLRAPLDDVAVGEGAVWAISGQAATVFHVDGGGSVRNRIRIATRTGASAPFPLAVAVGEGSVWVLDGNTQTVTRIDARLGGVTATIALGIGANPNEIAVGAGAVWVANGGNGTLARIDPRTNVETVIPIGGSPAGVAVAAGRVWVAVQPGFRVGVALPRGRLEASSTAGPQPLPSSVCSPVEFAGQGKPRYLIVSDLPLQGLASLAETLQQSDAVRFVLAQHRFRAGRYAIGYQLCDNSIPQTGVYDIRTCRRNAEAFAADADVIGVVGAYDSGCAQAQLGVLNRARPGPLPIVSNNATSVGLTHAGPGAAAGEPDKYYPSGTRNFARVVAADDVQGAADALLAKQLGVARLYVLHDADPYGFGIASNVRRVAVGLGVHVVGFAQWDPHARSYAALARKIRHARADAVFLGGSIGVSNGAELVASLRSVLGRRMRILAPDGFTPIAAFARLAGPAAEGVTVSVPAPAPERLRGKGRRFVAAFGKATGRPVEASTVAAAQAAEVLLEAIARSDGTRASVTRELLRTKVSNGILGSFAIDPAGDTTAGAVTIYRIEHGRPLLFEVLTPPVSLVRG